MNEIIIANNTPFITLHPLILNPSLGFTSPASSSSPVVHFVGLHRLVEVSVILDVTVDVVVDVLV